MKHIERHAALLHHLILVSNVSFGSAVGRSYIRDTHLLLDIISVRDRLLC